jgi:hypothetical protein
MPVAYFRCRSLPAVAMSTPPPAPFPRGPRRHVFGHPNMPCTSSPHSLDGRLGPLTVAIIPNASPANATTSPLPSLAGVYINQHVSFLLSLNPLNFSQWRILFEVMFQESVIVDHITGAPCPDNPAWVQVMRCMEASPQLNNRWRTWPRVLCSLKSGDVGDDEPTVDH